MSRDLRLCAWSAPVGMVFLGTALLPAAHFLPPLAPALDPAELAGYYRDHSLGIRIGAMLLMFGAACFVPFFGAISAALWRQTRPSAAYVGTQLVTGLMGITPLFFAAFFMAAAAFRAERSDDGILLLSDIIWLMLVMPAPPAMVQLVAIGLAILSDVSPRPVLPRWLAYLNFWVAILFAPGVLVPFFKHGPFAWDGLIAFWLPIGVFGIWLIVMVVMLLRIPDPVAEG